MCKAWKSSNAPPSPIVPVPVMDPSVGGGGAATSGVWVGGWRHIPRLSTCDLCLVHTFPTSFPHIPPPRPPHPPQLLDVVLATPT